MEKRSVVNRGARMLLYGVFWILVVAGVVGFIIWVGERIDDDRTYFTKQAQEPPAVEATPVFAEEYYVNNGHLLVRIRQLNAEYINSGSAKWDWEARNPGKILSRCSILDRGFIDCDVYTKLR